MTHTEIRKVAMASACVPSLAECLKPSKNSLKSAALKLDAENYRRRKRSTLKSANKEDIELLLKHYFPGVEPSAAIVVLLQRYALFRLDQFRRSGNPSGIQAAHCLMEKLNRLMTRSENLLTKQRNPWTKNGNLRPKNLGYGKEIGKAIDAMADKDRIWLLLYKIEDGKRRTPNELQKMAGNTSAPNQWKRLLRELGVPYKEDKTGPKGPRKHFSNYKHRRFQMF